jgi:hypothetical protein
MKQLAPITFCLFVCAGACSEIFAQRRAVSGAEVTGTFESYFKGKSNDNQILIQALGRNKIKIEMNLLYQFKVNRRRIVHTGTASGEAVIQGDSAVFTPDGVAAGDNPCKITLKFSKPGTLIVTTENGLECGFGLNVSADGRYKKTSGAKPKFSAN